MIRTILITSIFSLFITTNLFAQKEDSLYQVLESSQNIDSNFIVTLHLYLNDKSLNFSEGDIEWIREAKEYALSNQDSIQASEMYHYLGWYHYQKSQIEASIKNYLNAIKLVENKGQDNLLLKFYTNLANSYNASSDFQKAIETNLKTIQLVDQDTSSSAKARYYFYTAKTYDRMRDFDQAEDYYMKARRISEEANFPFGVILSNSSLGHNYNEQERFDEALPLLQSALSAFEVGGQSLNLAGAHSSLANCYRGLNQYDKAAHHYEKAIKLYLQIENTSYLKYNYTWLAYSYRMLGNSQKAFQNYDLAIAYADTLYKQERLQAVEELKTQYETEKYKQEKAIANANEEVAKQKAKNSKLVSYGAAMVSLLIAILLFYIYTRLKLIRKQKKKLDVAYEQLEESKKNELAVSNLKALQSQMNPHFIFNALNSVQDLVLLQDIRNSNKYLGKFSDLIRKILLSSKEQFISLTEEVEILSLYLDLEKLRFGEDFEIDFQCNVSDEKQDNIELPAMFIQPYIENAIKHGLFHKVGVKRLKVHFNLLDEYHLECIVEDNGIGQEQAAIFKEKRLHLHTGFSTEAINERIRLLNETLDQKIEIDIIDLFENEVAVGTKIRLSFPI